MTKDVIELAREAGIAMYPLDDDHCDAVGLERGTICRVPDIGIEELSRFADLVAARERERLGDDVKRLDFLAAEYWSPNPSFHYGNISVNLALPTVEGLQSESLRDAIDAEIRALNTEGEGNDRP